MALTSFGQIIDKQYFVVILIIFFTNLLIVYHFNNITWNHPTNHVDY